MEWALRHCAQDRSRIEYFVPVSFNQPSADDLEGRVLENASSNSIGYLGFMVSQSQPVNIGLGSFGNRTDTANQALTVIEEIGLLD